MTWTVAVPLKAAGTRKTRLAGVLDERARAALAETMLAHVLATLGHLPDVEVVVVSSARPIGWTGRWQDDGDAGLNQALAAARRAVGPQFAVVHADLPGLSVDDVRFLLERAAAAGVALAADRYGRGTNALAITGQRAFDFVFGPDSLRAFSRQGGTVIIHRPGLALDVDGPDDLALARAEGLIA